MRKQFKSIINLFILLLVAYLIYKLLTYICVGNIEGHEDANDPDHSHDAEERLTTAAKTFGASETDRLAAKEQIRAEETAALSAFHALTPEEKADPEGSAGFMDYLATKWEEAEDRVDGRNTEWCIKRGQRADCAASGNETWEENRKAWCTNRGLPEDCKHFDAPCVDLQAWRAAQLIPNITRPHLCELGVVYACSEFLGWKEGKIGEEEQTYIKFIKEKMQEKGQSIELSDAEELWNKYKNNELTHEEMDNWKTHFDKPTLGLAIYADTAGSRAQEMYDHANLNIHTCPKAIVSSSFAAAMAGVYRNLGMDDEAREWVEQKSETAPPCEQDLVNNFGFNCEQLAEDFRRETHRVLREREIELNRIHSEDVRETEHRKRVRENASRRCGIKTREDPCPAANCTPSCADAAGRSFCEREVDGYGSTCNTMPQDEWDLLKEERELGGGNVLQDIKTDTPVPDFNCECAIPPRVNCVGSWGPTIDEGTGREAPCLNSEGEVITCGEGTKSLTYTVSSPESGTGSACEASNGATKTVPCDLPVCVPGCTVPTASNYNPNANINDPNNPCTFALSAAAAAAAQASPFASDIRLKEELKMIGKSPSGVPIFQWRYKSNLRNILGELSGRYYTGTTAQSLLSMGRQDAVLRNKQTGYYEVDYNQLDVPFYEM